LEVLVALNKGAIPMVNVMTIDVEDYFHVSAFERDIRPHEWDHFPLRVIGNTYKILDLLDDNGVKATFFILGWIADRLPDLVREIDRRRHEIACHGYGHRRIYTQTRKQFRDDIRRSKALLEDLTGAEVLGYRAPSYSLSRSTFWAFDELYDAGYRFDSSIFPVHHDFYGIADWPRFSGYAIPTEQGAWRASDYSDGAGPELFEVPITTLRIGGKNLPIAGGGYFRLYPYWFSRWGLRRINREEKKPFVFYLHPWELDPDQPRIVQAGFKSRVRHYLNLGKTEKRFRKLLQDFKFSTIRDGIWSEKTSGERELEVGAFLQTSGAVSQTGFMPANRPNSVPPIFPKRINCGLGGHEKD
jgi:polysaccharide deacetylase family protein (PEP-CTERM system associated)